MGDTRSPTSEAIRHVMSMVDARAGTGATQVDMSGQSDGPQSSHDVALSIVQAAAAISPQSAVSWAAGVHNTTWAKPHACDESRSSSAVRLIIVQAITEATGPPAARAPIQTRASDPSK
jgi:hypothetical protein